MSAGCLKPWMLGLGLWLVAMMSHAAPVQDFGDPNLKVFIDKLASTRQGGGQVRVTQFGDSHTAADYFTATLRQRFQARFGDAGIGWVYPGNVAGQRNALVKLPRSGFSLLNSRRDNYPYFPLGGYVAQADSSMASITVQPRQPVDNALWKVRFWVKPQQDSVGALAVTDDQGPHKLVSGSNDSGWSAQELMLHMPFTIKPDQPMPLLLGGVELIKMAPGVILDSIGSNGAQLALWTHWNPDWPRQLTRMGSDLVILAYGVNEAYDPILDADNYRQNLQASIDLVRKALPDAAILMLGAQDAIKHKVAVGADCRTARPPFLDQVKQIQLQLARRNHLLYWDWQEAMGGRCSMPRWQQHQWARPDGVHFTAEGYDKLANDVFDGLMAVIKR